VYRIKIQHDTDLNVYVSENIKAGSRDRLLETEKEIKWQKRKIKRNLTINF